MNPSPQSIYGPRLATLMQKLAQGIQEECGATSVRIVAEFKYVRGQKGGGDLDLRTFTSPDARTERLLDPGVAMPRGSALQHEVHKKLSNAAKRLLAYFKGV